MADEKTCKHCAMPIPKDAKICPHCRKNQRLNLFPRILLFIVVFAVIIYLINDYMLWLGSGKSALRVESGDVKPSTAPTESLTTFSAYDLASAYDQNTVAADQRFKGKRFKVTGTVVDINTDFLDRPYLVLDGRVNRL